MELTHSLAAPKASAFTALITMFYEPKRAFEMLEQRTMAWFPLLLLSASTGALVMWYFSIVDFAWFQDQLLATVKEAEAREQAVKMMSSKVITMTTLTFSILALPFACAVFGIYFMIAGNFINKQIGFAGAFALSAWSAVPSLLLFPLGAIQILLAANGQLGFSELNPLSVNQLVFQHPMTHPMAAVLDSLSVTGLWSMALAVIGFQVWTKVSLPTALKVVLPPFVVFYGVWLAYALSQPV